MNYESLKNLNSAIRSKGHFSWYNKIDHFKIENIEGNIVFGTYYHNKQVNKQKVEVEIARSFTLEELIMELQGRKFYINNISKLKPFLA